jgi:hypothetical protein
MSYYLPAAGASAPQLTIVDRTGKTVRTLTGTSRRGINRVVWNLTETSACPGTVPAGRGRGAGGANASWIRALPGDYTVRLSAGGASTEQSLTVRLDPRVTATADDLQIYATEVRAIESIECSTAQALTEIQRIDAQLRPLTSSTTASVQEAATTVARELRAVAEDLSGGPDAPNALNLRGKINWLQIQVGGYTGRPTPAQREWIARFSADRDRIVSRLREIVAGSGSLARLNERLKSAGLAEITLDRSQPPR